MHRLFYFITCVNANGEYNPPTLVSWLAIGLITIGLGVCSWMLVKRQVKFRQFVFYFGGVVLFVYLFNLMLAWISAKMK